MNDTSIPENWTWVDLGESVDILDRHREPVNRTERKKRLARIDEKERIPYYGATGQVGWIDDHIFDEELVLLGEDGAPFLDPFKQTAYMIRGKSWINNHVHVLRGKSKYVNNKFLLYYLNTVDYKPFITGTTRYKLNQTRMKNIQIPVAPMNEQERLVAKIEELFSKLDAGLSELEQQKQLLEKYRKAKLGQAIWGGLTEKWRQKQNDLSDPRGLLQEPSKYSPPNGSDKPDIPDTWILTTFGDVFEVYIGSTPKRSNGKYWNGDINWISSGEVRFSKIKYSNEKITQAGLESCSTTIHPPNTVMLAIIGATRGRAAILDIEAAHNQNTIAVRPDDYGIAADYIYYFLMENFERTRRLGSGSAQKALSKSRVEKLVFPLPPVEEQKRISELLDRNLSIIDYLEQSLKANIKQSDLLRQSILKQTFEGSIVPQDPPEEPPTPDGGEKNLEQETQSTLPEVTSDVE